MPDTTQDVLARIDAERDRYLAELVDYLAIPSISADPAHAADVRRCAEWLQDKMETAGLETTLVEGDGHPIVYAEWTGAPGKPTLLFYGHYDVQPADPVEEWRNPPFEATREGDRLVARGATDDKGQSYAHLKAVAATLAERGELPINVKFIVEGEEESGGQHIERFVQDDAGRRLACDAVFVSDSSMYAPGQPSLVYGLKGLAYMEIEVDGPNRDLHSGSYGGAVANPLNALAAIVGKLVDPATGRVQIPGFYDAVRPLAEWERDEFGALPFDEEAFRADLGVPELRGEEGFSTLERKWARPTCDVNGIWGGYMEAGAKTIIPSKGGAKVSMRLVPDQSPDEIARLFTAYVEEIAPPGVRVRVKSHHGARPVLLAADGPIVEAALRGMGEEWTQPVKVREGGSIPVVSTFSEVLDVPVLLLGFGLEDDRLHSPNEKIDIPNFFGGIRAVARILDRLGAVETR